MNRKKIERFVKLLDGRDLSSLSIEIDGSLLKITKGRDLSVSTDLFDHPCASGSGFDPQSGGEFHPSGHFPPEGVRRSSSGPEFGNLRKTAESSDHSHVITSRYVGFFYSTSVSDMVQTLSIGDRVRKGQPVGMVESMGIEHVIKSDVEGILRSMEAIDGQPVEYGQSLFRLELENSQESAS